LISTLFIQQQTNYQIAMDKIGITSRTNDFLQSPKVK